MFSLKLAAEILTVVKLCFDITASWKKNGWGIPGAKVLLEELRKDSRFTSALSLAVKAELDHIINAALKAVDGDKSPTAQD